MPLSPDLLSQSRTRLVFVAAAFMVGYLAVSLRLADLTLLQGAAGEDAVLDAAGEDARRADIVDRNGALVATSLRMASVYADATLVDDAPALAARLARILPGEDRAALEEKLSSGRRFVWIARDVTPRQQYEINALGAPALDFREESRRIYPPGALLSHVTGYTDIDGNGIAGIEKGMDDALRAGEAPVALTIDLRVQHILRHALQKAVDKHAARAGAGIVMDARTGEVLALVSLPDFDPHHPAAAPDDARFNRATLGVFEPGSTFKLFSTAAALDSGEVYLGSTFDASEPIRYGRFTISDYHAKRRPLTVAEIFMYSSNIGTARMAQAAGEGALEAFYRKMGFFAPVPLEIPERGTPLYPDPWKEIHTLTASYGHGVAVSPLHVARAAAALVNGGMLVPPRLVRAEEGSPAAQPAGERVARARTSRDIRRLLALTVAGGTGGKAYAEGYDVGGKTGTAEKNVRGRYVKDKVIASFLGVFPMESPRYVVLAMVDEPHGIPETRGYVTGGWVAAPVVAEVVSHMAPLYNIPPGEDRRGAVLREMGKYLKEDRKESSLAVAGSYR